MKQTSSILRWFLVQMGYPLCEIMGRVFPKKRAALEQWFVRWNNVFVERCHPQATRLLVLLPHCLQFNACVHRITATLKNCRSCGKCVIADFVALEEQAGVPVRVATGGTIARRMVHETKPDMIIACACERDLSSGIYDSYPLCVWGITNERPEGPCINTTVDITKIQHAIDFFCNDRITNKVD